MVRDGVKPKIIYDNIISNTGCVYFSASQSNELRDSKQVYRQSQQLKAKKKFGNENYDELIAATELQREKKDFIRSVSCLRNSYYMFIADNVQLNDVAFFCVDKNGVLSIDTTFNLCSNWVADTCYENTRLQTQNGKHPFFLGPILIYFEKDAFIFNRFASEMYSFQSKIKNLKTIGTDQEMAIYIMALHRRSQILIYFYVYSVCKNLTREKFSN